MNSSGFRTLLFGSFCVLFLYSQSAASTCSSAIGEVFVSGTDRRIQQADAILLEAVAQSKRVNMPELNSTAFREGYDWSDNLSWLYYDITPSRRLMNYRNPIYVTLEELGFEPDYFKARVLLPDDINSIFNNYYLKIFNAIKEGKVSHKDAILPALLYIDTGGERHFVRPGVDSVQNGWTLHRNMGVIAKEEWRLLMAEGKMPFALDEIFFHDVAHLSEFFENLELMKAVRHYYADLLNAEKPNLNVWQKLTASSTTNSGDWLTELNQLLFESLALPNLKLLEAMKRVIPQLTTNSSLDLKQHVEYLRTLSPSELESFAKLFYDNLDGFVIPVGGAMRDMLNILNRHANGVFTLERLASLKNQSKNGTRSFKALDATFVNARDSELRFVGGFTQNIYDGPYGMILEIESLYQLMSKGSVSFSYGNSTDNMAIIDSFVQDLNKDPEFLKEVLIDRLARLQVALAKGAELNITPEKFVNESNPSNMSPQSDVAKWVNSFAHSKSNLHYILIGIFD